MSEVKLFENHQIRSIWNEEKEEWFFSIIDIVAVLTESANPRRYWSDLKRKMQLEEGANEVYEKIVQLKLKAPDGKMREKILPRLHTLKVWKKTKRWRNVVAMLPKLLEKL